MFKHPRTALATLASVFAFTVFAILPASAQLESSGCAAMNAGYFDGNDTSPAIADDFMAGEIINMFHDGRSNNVLFADRIGPDFILNGNGTTASYTIPATGSFDIEFAQGNPDSDYIGANWVFACVPLSATSVTKTVPTERTYLSPINDGRINNYDLQAPISVHPHSSDTFGNGFEIYDEQGVSILLITRTMIDEADWEATRNTYIAGNLAEAVRVSRLADGNIRVAGLMDNGKTYIMLLDAETFDFVSSYEIEQAG